MPCSAGRAGLQIGTGRALLGAPIFWVEVLLVYLITFSLRFAERSARWLFFPNDDMVLAERELQVRECVSCFSLVSKSLFIQLASDFRMTTWCWPTASCRCAASDCVCLVQIASCLAPSMLVHPPKLAVGNGEGSAGMKGIGLCEMTSDTASSAKWFAPRGMARQRL